ncbi:MAG: hypothetical protein V3V75_05370 [Thermoguttaceae bacterium]
MPSSKFNRLPVPRLRPAICFPPPGSCRKTYTANQPPWIAGRFKWKDWHPPKPIDWFGIIECQWDPASSSWKGKNILPDGYVTMDVWPIGLFYMYTLHLYVHVNPAIINYHTWFNIPSRSETHVDTGNLSLINQPDIDYREARAVA